MKRAQPIVAGVLVLAVLGTATALLVTRHSSLVTRRGGAAATYYCPMHPTYTSDRPGDCPICAMKLVKLEEPEAPAASAPAHEQKLSDEQAIAKRFASICYLHNCAKLHQGQPCPMTVVAKPGEKVICPICGTHIAEAGPPVKKILYWTDPMIPGYRAEGPGKSPMGMDLVPVYEEEVGGAVTATPTGYAPVLLSAQKQQLIGVKTALVESRRLTKTIRAAGTVAHDPELYQAQVEYLEAIRAQQQARQASTLELADQTDQLVAAAQTKLRHLGLSEELIQEMALWEDAQKSLLYVQPGEPVWVYAKIYESDLPLVRPGQEVTIEVPAIPGARFHGTIRAIDRLIDPMTRTVRVRVEITDARGELRPDMFVNASLVVDLGELLAVPAEAVFSTGERAIVFVDKGQGLFEPRDVTLGVNADAVYQITAGLSVGERVVTSGNFLIDSESRLKAALAGASTGEGAHEHSH